LKHIKRTYSRYGITKELFIHELKAVKKPSAILVTSMMTYWYPGVFEAIKLVKELFPNIPVILGGIYAKLCNEHAIKFSGADIVSHDIDLKNMGAILNILADFGIHMPGEIKYENKLVYPAFDLLNNSEYACILTSTGCPYGCRYCASSFLNPVFFRKDPESVVQEIIFWKENLKIMDFAFYDDALLIDSTNHIKLILENVIKKDLHLRFHTPNALHVREISMELAALMYQAGFKTIRLGLETSDIEQHRQLDNKVSEGEFEQAVKALRYAGFQSKDIGVYILMGLPGQSVESIKDTLRFVADSRTNPYLAEYSPLPHTLLWDTALECSEYDLASEPLFHNNSIVPCWDEDKRLRIPELKKMVREIRQGLV